MAMEAPLQVPPMMSQQSSMLDDIWSTPEVIENMLERHVSKVASDNTAFSPPSRAESTQARGHSCISFPGMDKPLEKGHFSGRTPLEVMSGCKWTNQKASKHKFIIIGSGSSYNVAMLAEYYMEQIARIPVEVQYASEFRIRRPLLHPGDVLVVVSQSGETSDSVKGLQLVRDQVGPEIFIVGIVNAATSTIADKSDWFINIEAGTEFGITSTKGFSCSVLALMLLAMALGEVDGSLSDSERSQLLHDLQVLPNNVRDVLNRHSRDLRGESGSKALVIGECKLWDISCQNVLAQNFIFLGRGCNFPIALEGAMKCKEISYIHAEGYPAAEMKHGPIALIDHFMPVVFIAPRADPTYQKIKANIEEVKTRNGALIVITEDDDNELEDLCEYVIRVPQTHEYLMPLVSVVPLQLLAYMMGVLRCNKVDNPEGLHKVITA